MQPSGRLLPTISHSPAFYAPGKHGGQRGQRSEPGLAITARLAQMLGGRVRLDSRLGEGSVFSLIIPIFPQAESQLPAFQDAMVR